MCRSLSGWFLLLSLTFGCGPSERGVPGLLDDFGVRADALYRREDRLYNAYGDSIYSLDVSDPQRMRETDSDAWGDVGCAVACPGYFWQEGHAFIVGRLGTEVAKVSLPNGPVPVWVFEQQAYADAYTWSSVRISDDTIALAQGDVGTGGRLLAIQVDPSPAVVGSLDMTFSLLTAAVHSSGFVFSSTNSIEEQENLLVFDVRDPANPALHEMIDLGMGSEFRPAALAVRNMDLFVTARSADGAFQFNWYRLAEDFRSVREIQRNTDVFATPSESAKPVFYDRFLFVPGLEFGDDGEGVAVYVIDDTSAGLQLVSHTPKSSPGSILVDSPRRVAYFGGGGIWAMDLDHILGLSD